MSTNKNDLDEQSPSVQTHLAIIQSVIQRMSTNSTSSKTWCITIVSAILVVVADKGRSELAYIACIPTFLFFTLDAYYLALEKAFRASYNNFVDKIHKGIVTPDDIYLIEHSGKISSLQLSAMLSFSTWGFYLMLIILIILTKLTIISV